MDYSMVPDELKQLTQWGLYRRQWNEDKGKYDKFPIDPWTGLSGKSNDPKTWSNFNVASQAMEEYQADGLAFYFANGYIGLDIDHIRSEIDEVIENAADNNIPPDNTLLEVSKMTNNTYMELSMSGEGIHVIFKGKLTRDRRRKGNVEMYPDGRFFALTGDAVRKVNHISNLNESKIKKLEYWCFGKNKVMPIQVNYSTATIDLSTDEIINRIMVSESAGKFSDLMNGDYSQYPSQSEADMALANLLAFWCAKDYAKMDEIFRDSGLYRPKYDERHGKTTYGDALLNKAINEVSDIYKPKREMPSMNYGMKFLEDDSQKKLPNRSWDDMGNAQRFLDHFQEEVKYSYTDNAWFFYNGMHWERDERGEIQRCADKVVEGMKDEKVEFTGDEKEREKMERNWQKFLKKSRMHNSKNAMLSEVKHHVSIEHGEFDKEQMLLNTQSGYVDLSTGILHDHDVKLNFSQIAGSEYTDHVDCPEWLDFLDTTFEDDKELIHFIQKAVGYSATASTREQVMFFPFGDGKNGKSVFINTIAAALGSYAKTMDAKTIMVQRGSSSGANSDIARLENARLVIASESNEGERLDESRVKQLTGGDKVVARYLYGSEFEYTPKYKIWMATNHKPIIRGTDKGIWRRIVLIPFIHTISDEEVDKDLESKLERELPGILNWIVEGAMMWQREGLKPPTKVTEASQDYRKEMDVYGRFIEDTCEVGKDYEVQASALYQAYKQWAKENSEYEATSTKFGREMVKRYEKRKAHGVMVYKDIRIKQDSRTNFLS